MHQDTILSFLHTKEVCSITTSELETFSQSPASFFVVAVAINKLINEILEQSGICILR